MKSRIVTATCAVVVACLFGAIALAATANGQSKRKNITLRVSSELENVHLVDNPPTGLSVGDVLIFTEKLLNRKGKIIGHDAATCTSLFDQRSLCTGTYELRSGEIMVQLLQPGLSGTLTYDQAIVGGTGRYAGVGGTVTVHQRPSGDRLVFHIRLQR